MKDQEYPIIHFATTADFDTWLSENHTSVPGIWAKLAKKGSKIASITYQEALIVALTYGWIDGQSRKVDEQYWIQKFTPRGPRSIWSKRNCEIVIRLTNEGKMKPSGLAAVEAAKKDGRWERAYDSPRNMVVPQDFLTALAKEKKAEAFFKTLSKTNIFAISFRLQTAKKPETRERRMKNILQMLKNEEKFH